MHKKGLRVSFNQMFSAACGGAVRPGQGQRVGSGPLLAWPCSADHVAGGGPGQAPNWLLCLPFQDSKQLHVAAADQPGAGAEAVPHGEGHPPMPAAPSTLVPGAPALAGHCQPRSHPLAQAEAGSHALFPDTQNSSLGLGLGLGLSHPLCTEWRVPSGRGGAGFRPLELQWQV